MDFGWSMVWEYVYDKRLIECNTAMLIISRQFAVVNGGMMAEFAEIGE
ncbi:hypothetical protein [Chromobacterium sp. CV08]